MASRGEKTLQALLKFSLSLPEAHEDHPWGEVVAKVRKKVFVFFGTAETRGDGVFLCVKLPESGPVLLDQEWAEPAGYGLGKSGWVSLTLRGADIPPRGVLEDWIEESYRAVAPKGCVKVLDGEAAAPVRRAAPRAAARPRKRTVASARAPAVRAKAGKKSGKARKKEATRGRTTRRTEARE